MKSLLDIVPESETIAVDNKSTLILEDLGKVYCVKFGVAYLFAANTLEDGRTGSRYHIATFEAGEAFFPLDPQPDASFLVTGTLGTTVASFDAETFFERCGRPENLASFESCLVVWIRKITENLRRKNASDKKTNYPLEGTGEYPPKVQLYAPGLKWVIPGEGVFAFDGAPLSDWTQDLPYPVTPEQAVYVVEPKLLTVQGVDDLASGGRLRAAVSAYAAKCASLLRDEKEASHRAEDDRIKEKFARADDAFSSMLGKVSAVLDGTDDRFAVDRSEEGEQDLFLAARLAARASGVDLRAIQGKEYAREKNGVDEVAKDNNVRVRRVLLRGEWWREDNGPLLAFMSDSTDGPDIQEKSAGSRPVALIPRSEAGYYAIDPESEEKRFVDRESAARIEPFAYMFYRPLPNKKMDIVDVFKFTSEGLKTDALRYAVLGVLATLIGMLIPEITKVFTDTIIPEAAKNQMVQLTMLIVLSTITAGIFDLVKGISMTRLETKSDLSLQAAVMDRVVKLPVPFFRSYTAGDLAERTLAISQIRRILSGTILSSFMGFIFSLTYLFQLFRYSSDLAKWGLLFCLIPIVFTAVISVLQYKFDKQVADIQGSMTGTLLQFMMGVGKLNITASEKRAFGVWAQKFIEKKKKAFASGYINNVHATFTDFFPVILTTLFYVLYMKGLEKGLREGVAPMSTGTFLAFMASFTAFQTALVSMTSALTKTINVVPLYKRAQPILDGLPEVLVAKPSVSELKGAIEVDHVSFRYTADGPLVLNDVSFKTRPGEFVALVGGSGSGKSTLLRLLLGFEKAESGSIFFDNKDIDSYDITSVRRQMGVVLQNGSIMRGSIYQNIVGSSLLTIDDAWEAARMVGLDEDIQAMPMGMYTELSPGAGTLSGGQRQRLIIARAIIRKPNILFFDEATSALDNKTQSVVSASLESLNVTRIVIAHRLSTVLKADRIYVLQNGVMEESGTYRELMDRKGAFFRLAERQQL